MFTNRLRSSIRQIVYHLYQSTMVRIPGVHSREAAARNVATAIVPVVRLVDFNGVRLGVYLSDRGVIEDHILGFGEWSGDLLNSASWLLPENPVIVEVGANVGFESLYFARRYPSGEVIALEPGNYGYRCMEKSKAYNRLDNLTIYKLAAGASAAQFVLRSPTSASRNKGLGSFHENPDIDDTYVEELVDVVTLDSLISERKRVDLLKIDTQGHEKQVLAGSDALLRNHRPIVIFEFEDHYHPNPHQTRSEISDIFESLQYSLFTHTQHSLVPFDLRRQERVHCDVFALPEPATAKAS